MKSKIQRKISRKLLLGVALIALLSLTLGAMGVLISTDSTSNSVKIKGINLNIVESSLPWSDLIEGTASNQTLNLTIQNTKNVNFNVTFSDDLAVSGLSMDYPAPCVLSAGDSISKGVTLVYDGTATYGDYSWSITVTGTET